MVPELHYKMVVALYERGIVAILTTCKYKMVFVVAPCKMNMVVISTARKWWLPTRRA